MKALIVNADDFGLSASVNRGIIECHTNGIVTSATILTNMPGFEHAVRRAGECPNLGVGVHLNVLRGTPLSDPKAISSLVDRSGKFLGSAWSLVRRLARGGVSGAHLRLEFDAQLDRAIGAGIDVSHVDSEQHLHAVPTIFRAAARSARQKGVLGIRLPSETPRLLASLPRDARSLAGRLKSSLIRTLALSNRGELARSGLLTTEHFFGIGAQERLDAGTLKSLARVLPLGTCEVTCHPGYVDDELLAISGQVGGYWVNRVRESELAALTDRSVQQEFRENEVALINFRHLPPTGDTR